MAATRVVLAVLPGPTFGGAPNQVLRLHGPLLEAGWRLVAVVQPEADEVARRLADGGVEVVRQPMHRLRATRDLRTHAALLRHTRSEVRGLRRLVRRFGAAIVQNHGDLNPQGGLAGHLEGAAVHWHLLDSRTPMALRRLTMPLVTRLADSISTVGHALADSHHGARSLGERCIVVYPPVDEVLFRDALSPARRAAARAELGVPEEAVCIGAIGNRNPQKGQDWLVRAVAIARGQRSDLVVRILGAPSPGHEDYEQGVRRAASEAGLDETGFAIVDPGRRVPELIGALDILCMPSVPRSEGMPTVIIEAMAAGLPVVATDVGAVAEVVRDGVTGRVVPPLEASSMAAAILDAIEHPEYGAAGRARAEAEFGLDRLRDLYVRGYELAVEHRLGRR